MKKALSFAVALGLIAGLCSSCLSSAKDQQMVEDAMDAVEIVGTVILEDSE